MTVPRDRFGLVGRTIADRVRVDRVIGEGGFGVVYEGTHLVLNKRVAIKCSKPASLAAEDQERSAQIFLREGQILFELSHPAIVRLFDVGVIPEGGIQYAVLELVPGRTLKDEIEARERERRPFTRDELGAIFVPVLEGLAFAHARGVVHRDLKPANIMLVPGGSPRILDFGTARSDTLDVAAGTLGMTFTPLYAAPEQWDSRFGTASPQTDVFAIGLSMLHACLLRYPLPVGDTMLSIVRAVTDDTSRPRLTAERPDLPAELGEILLRATRARQEERFADARDMLTALRRVLGVVVSTAPLAKPMASGAPPPFVSAPPPAIARSAPLASFPAPAAPKPRSPLPWILGGAAGLLVLVGAVVSIPLFLTRRAEVQANTAMNDEVDAATRKPLPPGPHRHVTIGNVVGGTQFWNQPQLMRVLQAHKNDVVACADQGAALDPGLRGEVSIIVHPTAEGEVESIQCSMMSDGHIGEPPQQEVCSCLAAAMGQWRFGKSKGPSVAPLGRNFIVSFRIEP